MKLDQKLMNIAASISHWGHPFHQVYSQPLVRWVLAYDDETQTAILTSQTWDAWGDREVVGLRLIGPIPLEELPVVGHSLVDGMRELVGPQQRSRFPELGVYYWYRQNDELDWRFSQQTARFSQGANESVSRLFNNRQDFRWIDAKLEPPAP